MAPDPVAPVFHYRAFISYSHQDKAWADWLHKSLETYAVPRRLVGQTTAAGIVPRKLAPIFRDREELATATDLGRKVNEALKESASLIVICSPRSASSHWVNEEVLAFKRMGRSERIFSLIVDGEPNASDMACREAEECFALALRHHLDANGELGEARTEPIAADVRPGKDGKTNAKLKLIAGLLDVGFDDLKRREQQRRTRRLTVLAAVATVIMVITSALAVVAVIARQAAERRQKQAEELVDFMLGDLGDKLQQVARLDIMEAVDEKAMRYFQSLPVMDVTDESLEQRMKALEKIGSLRLDQGHLPAAMESFRAASSIGSALIRRAPDNVTRLLEHARIQAFIGMTFWRQGQMDDARHNFEAARATLDHAAATSPNDMTLKFESAMVENNIGHVLEVKGQLDEAEAPYRRELALCKQLVEAKPDNTDWNTELGSAHNNLGKLALMRGDLATAVTEYAADVAIEVRMSEKDPKDNNQKENVVTSSAILGRTLALTGDIDAGTRHLQKAVDLASQLLAIDEKNTLVQDDFALYSSQLSRLMRLSGNAEVATRHMDNALAMFATLVKQDPSNTSWQREFAEVRTEQAEQLQAAGHRDQAMQQARASEAALAPLIAQQPDDRSTLLAWVNTQRVLAALTDDNEAAQHIATQSLDRMRAVTHGSDDPRLLGQQVSALIALNRMEEAKPLIQKLWNSGYHDLAFVNMLKDQRVDYPVNTAFSRELASRMQ